MVKRLFHRGFSLRTIKHWLVAHWPLFLLIGIIAILAFLNYQSNTQLIGWDNLQSDFNLDLNIRRAFFSVWQEYQSLGLLGGMAHAADITRLLFLSLLGRIGFPQTTLRYSWHFFALALGPISTYFLLHHIFLKPKFDPQTKKIASFLGALFYLLNLATLQYFFTPYESFSSFYAFFPLLLLVVIDYLDNPKPKETFVLVITLLASTSAFYVQTLFLTFCLCLVPIVAIFFSNKKYSIKNKILAFFGLVIIIFSTQAFWLLPQVFFVLTKANDISFSHVNLISTIETYYRNLEYTNLRDFVLLRGFWFSFTDLAGGSKFDYLMTPWRNHLANPIIAIIGYLAFALVVTGIIYSLKKKLPYIKSFLGILTICYFFLLGGSLLIDSKIPLIGELFRSPFTKFSIPLALTYSIFFTVGCIFLLDLFSFLHSRLTYYLTLFTVTLALIIFMTPAFTGNLISPTMRLKLPAEYRQLFDFFKNQDPATRIANFPQYTFWGWNYYDWPCPAEASCVGGGYRGSGFLWYGIKQPILDRAFDVWEKSSERYYEEISTALYSENQKEFENVIDKYAVNWILLDKNVISPNANQDLGNEKLLAILTTSPKFTLAENITDKILIYKTDVDKNVKNFLAIKRSDLLTTEEVRPLYDLPLRPLALHSLGEGGFAQITNDTVTLTAKVEGNLTIPSYTQTENLLPTSLAYRKTALGLQLKFEPILPEIKVNQKSVGPAAAPVFLDFTLPEDSSGLILGLNDQYLEVALPDELTNQSSFYPLTNLYLPSRESSPVSVYSNIPTFKLDLTSALSQATPAQCYTAKPNRKIEKIVAAKTISLFGTDLVGCLSAPLPPGSINQLISLEFTYHSPTGTPANANITNRTLGGANSPQPLSAKKAPTFSRVFAKPLFEPLQANLILEANESKSTQEIIYQNVSVSYLPLLGETSFIPNSVPGNSITAVEGVLSVSIPLLDTPYTVTATAENMNSEARNCDNFNQGQFTRQITDSGFLYTSLNANSCDQLNGKHLPHETNYAVIVDAENQKGLFPTICLQNHATRRCDVFERLINGQQIILQPITNPNELTGYTLHLFNQSFGNPIN